MKHTLLLIFLLVFFRVDAQLKIINGTNVKINTGTTVFFKNSDTLQIENGVYFQNDGLMELPFDYYVKEFTGYPIFGIGKENIIFFSNSSNQITPGNLGFSFKNITSNDTLFIQRFHDTIPNASFNCVKRYFHLFDTQNNPVSVISPKITADSVEYDSPANIWHFIGSDLSSYTNYGKDTCGLLFSSINDTVTGYEYFSLSPFEYFVDPRTTDIVCGYDSIHLVLNIQGAYENNSLWIGHLSDEQGNFITTNFDSSYLNNGVLFFDFSTTGLLAGSNYKIRIREVQTEWLFTLSPFIIDIPPVPIIQINFDSLTVQNYNQGIIEWYLNGNLLIGENDSVLVVNANGAYTVNFVSSNNCVGTADTTYTSNSVSDNNFLPLTTLFPNPAKDYLIINYSGNYSNAKFYNSIGQNIFNTPIVSGQNKIFILHSIFQPGIYIVTIDSNPIKFVIE